LVALGANTTTNINNEFELQVPANQTNTKTVVGEIAPYISSVSPNPATVGQSMTITGQRLSGQDGLVVVYIDGQVIPAGSLTTNINGTSLTFTVPSLSSGVSHTLQLKNQTTGASNMVAFQVTGNSTPTLPVINGAVTAVNHAQNPGTSQGLIYVSWPSLGSGYTYTVTASPGYPGNSENTTATGINMGCYIGGCFNGGGPFPTNGPYTFTVTAVNNTMSNATKITIGTASNVMVSPVPTTVTTAVCPAGYTCVPAGSSLTCPAGYTCTTATANCPTGYTCETATASQVSNQSITSITSSVVVGGAVSVTGSGFDDNTVVIISGPAYQTMISPTIKSASGLQFTVPSSAPAGTYNAQTEYAKGTNPAQSNVVTFTVTSAAVCPAGYTCVASPGTPANGACPVGYTCTQNISTLPTSTPPSTPAPVTITAINHSQNPATAQGLIYVSWPSQGSGYTYTITASPAYTGSVETTTGTGVNMGCYAGGCFNGGGAFPGNGPYTFTVTATDANGNSTTIGTSNAETVSPVSTQSASVWQSFLNLLGF
jgi:hypothetical protein